MDLLHSESDFDSFALSFQNQVPSSSVSATVVIARITGAELVVIGIRLLRMFQVSISLKCATDASLAFFSCARRCLDVMFN